VVVSLAKLWWWLRVRHASGSPSPLPEPVTRQPGLGFAPAHAREGVAEVPAPR